MDGDWFRVDAGWTQPLTLTAGRDYRSAYSSIGSKIFTPINERLTDLLRIASAVYVADRVCRRPKCSGHGRYPWCRTIRLTIPVFDTAYWSDLRVEELLSEAVNFVSGDTWMFNFEQADRRTHRRLQQKTLFDFEQPPEVILYSGGLDSAAGLGALGQRSGDRPILCVSAIHQSQQLALIKSQLETVRQAKGAKIDLCPVKFSLIHSEQLKNLLGDNSWHDEGTQRSRSFFFCSIAGVAAALTGSDEVSCFESGVGAINLPFLQTSTGSRMTRGAHPRFLRAMSELLTDVIQRPFHFSLPFWNRTKAESCEALRRADLGFLARASASCVSFPLREKPHKQCGFCFACITRRQAMIRAGIDEPPPTYKVDLFAENAVVADFSESHLIPLEMVFKQLGDLEGVAPDGRAPAAVEAHLWGTGVVRSEHEFRQALDLLHRYQAEWSTMIDRYPLLREFGKKWISPSQGRGASRAIA